MYRAAVIGLGQMGLMYDFQASRPSPSSHVMAYASHPEIDLVACSDIRDEPERYLKEKAPDARFYRNMTDMLRYHSVDVVSICTPPQEHLNVIRTVLELSDAKIIFCEKPLVNDVRTISELRAMLQNRPRLLIPNLSRRWNRGIIAVREMVQNQHFGPLENIHLRYTKGIYNTGSHLFDLVRYFASDFDHVRAVKQVHSSAARDGDPSFSFTFALQNGITGYAEAFNDENYYMFEIDLYFQHGKIEISCSGDEIEQFEVVEHPLFAGFKMLSLKTTQTGILQESSLKHATNHIIDLLSGKVESPVCTVEDGLYPLWVADALERSYKNNGSMESVSGVSSSE